MVLLSYLLRLAILASGPLAGATVGLLAREELEAGSKWFLVLEDLLLLLVLGVVWFNDLFSPLLLAGLAVIVFLLILQPYLALRFSFMRGLRGSVVPTILFVFLVFASIQGPGRTSLLLIGFIYGLPEGSRQVLRGTWKNHVVQNAIIVFVAGSALWFFG